MAAYNEQHIEIFANTDLNGTVGSVPEMAEIVWELSILLECTDKGDAGRSYGPPEDCWEAEDPEFEARSYKLTGDAGVVIYDGKDHKIIEAIIGEEVLNNAIDQAIESAIEEPFED